MVTGATAPQSRIPPPPHSYACCAVQLLNLRYWGQHVQTQHNSFPCACLHVRQIFICLGRMAAWGEGEGKGGNRAVDYLSPL